MQEGTGSGYNTFKRLRGQELGRESFQTMMQFDICEKRREEAGLGRARQTTSLTDVDLTDSMGNTLESLMGQKRLVIG